MKYYIIAGEASGDLHGANLITALKERDHHAVIRCWGGDRMAAAGGQLVKHIRDLSFMGFVEVLRHLPTILRNIRYCKEDILAFQPDAVILIDFPGFNFRLFKFIKAHSFRLYYYISPQLWAWKTSRVKKVREYVDRMFVIFPFEKDFYAGHGVEVDFVGHPLLDELQKRPPQEQENATNIEKTIALLPGSRRQEVKRMLPEYLKVIPHFPGYIFVIAGIRNLGPDLYKQITANSQCQIEWDNTYDLLSRSYAAIVTSGTATLETALFNVPEVVCYRASPFSYFIAKLLVKGIRFICIVNLIANRLIVTELIQNEVNEEKLKNETDKILAPEERSKIFDGYKHARSLLGQAGASAKTAELILERIKEK